MTIEKVTLTDCGCYFEYENDLSKSYLARWILCGKNGCLQTEARRQKARMLAEIKVATERLNALRAEFNRRWPV
jgi:hypothetical protein